MKTKMKMERKMETKMESNLYTNSEINNQRFDRSKTKTPNKDGNFKLKEKENSKTANKKIVSIYNSNPSKYEIKENVIYDLEKDDEEELEENLPKPLNSRLGLDYVRVNDFKTNYNSNNNFSQKVSIQQGISNGNSHSNLLYMPDHMASKLVDDILQTRLYK